MLTDNIILECFFNLLTDSILLYYKNMFNRIGLMGYKKIILTSAVLYINEKNGSVFFINASLVFLEVQYLRELLRIYHSHHLQVNYARNMPQSFAVHFQCSFPMY